MTLQAAIITAIASFVTALIAAAAAAYTARKGRESAREGARQNELFSTVTGMQKELERQVVKIGNQEKRIESLEKELRGAQRALGVAVHHIDRVGWAVITGQKIPIPPRELRHLVDMSFWDVKDDDK